MKNKKLLLSLLAIGLLSSCNVKISSTTSISGSTSIAQGSISYNGGASSSSAFSASSLSVVSGKVINYNNQEIEFKDDQDEINDVLSFNDLFDLNNHIQIDIEINEAELEKIQSDYNTGYKSEIYHHASKVTISVIKENKTYTNVYYDVGIRQKGNTSRDDIYNEDGSLNFNHYKLSFDETFEDTNAYGAEAYVYSGAPSLLKKREDRNLLGLSGLDIKWNKNYDYTHIKEVYASKVYQENGIISQHVGLTTCKLTNTSNNKYIDLGVCTLYEPATKSMIKRALQSDTSYLNMGTWKQEKNGTYGVEDANYGDLYKCSYGVGEGSSSKGANLSSSSGSGKRIGVGNLTGSYIPTYERKTNTDVSYADTPLRTMLSTIDGGNYDSISNVIDLDYFAMVEACNYMIGNPDDLRNNNNNYMIYIRRTDGKAIIIPIDNDRCFGIIKDYDPDGNGMTKMEPLSTKRASGGDVNKLYTSTILSSSHKDKYVEDVIKVSKEELLSKDSFNNLYIIAKTTYGADANDFANEHDVNYSYNEYIDAKQALVNSLVEKEDNQNENGDYGNAYLNGSFVSWNAGKNYPFTFNGNGEYSITFTPSQVDEGGYIKCKIYDGVDYSTLDWSLTSDLTSLLMTKESSFRIDNVTTSSVITITVNTLTKVASVTIK